MTYLELADNIATTNELNLNVENLYVESIPQLKNLVLQHMFLACREL